MSGSSVVQERSEQESGEVVAPVGDPAAQAEFFLGLIERLGEVGDEQADRIRLSLLLIVKEYYEARLAGSDMELAQAKAALALVRVEMGIAEYIEGSLRKLHDRLARESSRMGLGDHAGQQLRDTAEKLGELTGGLRDLLDALKRGDVESRDAAHARLMSFKDTVSSELH